MASLIVGMCFLIFIAGCAWLCIAAILIDSKLDKIEKHLRSRNSD